MQNEFQQIDIILLEVFLFRLILLLPRQGNTKKLSNLEDLAVECLFKYFSEINERFLTLKLIKVLRKTQKINRNISHKINFFNLKYTDFSKYFIFVY